MVNITLLSFLSILGISFCGTSFKWPTIGISVLVRNKANILPYFFSCLTKLDYPKDRIYIWIYSDNNEDNSIEIINDWAMRHESEYNGVYITTNTSSEHLLLDKKKSCHWSPEHFKHIIRLREEALIFGRKMWADYVFMIDADVVLTEPSTLKSLVIKEKAIVAPMLISDGLYSNFWCGMTENYYYKRTDDYKAIHARKNVGCHDVPMVHTAVFISMRHKESDNLTYVPSNIKNYDGPEDDIIAFAVNAKKLGLPLYVCNDYLYGFVPVPAEDNFDFASDYEQIINIKLEAISHGSPIPLNSDLSNYVTYPEPKWKFGCDEIFMINLERRKERRHLMELSFNELGMDATLFKAFDGRLLDLNDLSQFSITLMPNYEDPSQGRPMKAGEVGCFLSHYYIWENIVEKHYSITLVLEDDIHFVPYFRYFFLQLMKEIKQLDWDLVYIGRKILLDSEEKHATEHTTIPLYSYWTLGYLITERGARKLLDAEPLSKMLPVDEFLPIMFDQHPNETWKSYFATRNLKAFSATPLLVHPTHYTGDKGYISDTEDSAVIDVKKLRIEL